MYPGEDQPYTLGHRQEVGPDTLPPDTTGQLRVLNLKTLTKERDRHYFKIITKAKQTLPTYLLRSKGIEDSEIN